VAIVLPLVPQTIKLELHWTLGSDANVMSHMYYSTAAATPSTNDLLAFATLFATSYNTNMVSQTHSSVALRKVRGIWLGDRTSAVPEWNGTYTGNRAGTPLPAQTAVLFNLRIARRYRGGKPRLYFPGGVAADMTDPQHWLSTFLTSCGNAMTAINNALQAFTSATINTPFLVNVSYYSGKSLRTAPVVDAVSAITMNSIPGSQRRRLRP